VEHTGWFAGAFGFIAFVLAVITVVQAWALYSQGWRLALGTVPEAIAAIGTVGALLVALGVWRHEVAVRRTDERQARAVHSAAAAAAKSARADQARLVILEFTYDELTDLYSGGEHSIVVAKVKNLSSRPIFDVRIEIPEDNAEMRLLEDQEPTNTPNTPKVKAIADHGEHQTRYEHLAPRIDWEWINVVPFVHYVDANGARWTRTATSQPHEIITTTSATIVSSRRAAQSD
jgi:hypothetical protein